MSGLSPRALLGRRVGPVQVAVVAVVVALLAEGGVRLIDEQLPREIAGDTVEIELKFDQLTALSEQGEPCDVVMLGNSTLDAGVDPVLLAEQSSRFDAPYNAALLGAPLTAINRWAGEFVLPLCAADTVVIGVTPLDVPNQGIFGVSRAAVAGAFETTFNRIHPSTAQRVERDLSEHSHLIRRRNVFRNPGELWRGITGTITNRSIEFAGDAPVTLVDGRQLTRDRATWEQELLGPRGTNRTYWGATFDGTVSRYASDAERRALETSVIDRMALDQLMATIAEAGIDDVVIVIPPHHRDAMVANGLPLAAFDRLAADIVAYGQRVNAPVIDMSQTQWSDADFFDAAHLSRQGGQRFTRVLAEALDEL